MDKEAVINQLISIRDNTDLLAGDKKDIEALNIAISILRKEQSRKFNRGLVDRMLTEINEEYFSDKKHNGLWDVMENVKYKYRNEIATLPE